MRMMKNLLVLVLVVIFSSIHARADSDESVRKVSEANMKFSLDLYKTLTTQNELKSFATSPFSISTLFSMLLVGAEGDTAEEIRTTLGYNQAGINDSDVQSAFRQILHSAQSILGADIANGLWSSKSFPIEQGYNDSLAADFRAKEDELDFSSINATETINNWVAEETGGKIETLFDDPLPPSTILVLVNAIYFKASWKIQFPKDQTKVEKFQGEEKSCSVKMMHVKDKFNLYRCRDLQSDLLEMNYADSNTSMVVLLPFRNSNLTEMEDKLTPETLIPCLDKLKGHRFTTVDVSLPKFKLEDTYDLIPIMTYLNTTLVFSEQADLTGISAGVYVTDGVQKAFIEVDEEGTTAAAASGVSLSRTVTPSFKADRPFTFLIRNKDSNLISFIGRYAGL